MKYPAGAFLILQSFSTDAADITASNFNALHILIHILTGFCTSARQFRRAVQDKLRRLASTQFPHRNKGEASGIQPRYLKQLDMPAPAAQKEQPGENIRLYRTPSKG